MILPLALCSWINFCKLDGYLGERTTSYRVLVLFTGHVPLLLLETISGLHSCEYLRFIGTLQVTESENDSGQKRDLEVTCFSRCRIIFQVRFTFKVRPGCSESHRSWFEHLQGWKRHWVSYPWSRLLVTLIVKIYFLDLWSELLLLFVMSVVFCHTAAHSRCVSPWSTCR